MASPAPLHLTSSQPCPRREGASAGKPADLPVQALHGVLKVLQVLWETPFHLWVYLQGVSFLQGSRQEVRLNVQPMFPWSSILRGGPKLQQAWTLDRSHDGAGGRGDSKGSLAAQVQDLRLEGGRSWFQNQLHQ